MARAVAGEALTPAGTASLDIAVPLVGLPWADAAVGTGVQGFAVVHIFAVTSHGVDYTQAIPPGVGSIRLAPGQHQQRFLVFGITGVDG